MKTMIWLGAALFGTAVAIGTHRTGPLARPGAESPQVVRIGEMSVARAAHQATRFESGKVLITGGCSGQCDRTLSQVEAFDPTTGRFEPLPAMARARDSHAAVALEDGRVLVAGGWSQRHATASVEMFDPATGRFSSSADMTQARAVPVATRLTDGRVLITGGQTSQMSPLASAELFDPASDRFSVTGSMRSARIGHAAVALADGRVLVTGGLRARRGAVLRSAEVFDPASGRFELTGDMAFPRQKHAAVRLPDGKVLVVGGSDSGPRSDRYRTTELYDPVTGRFSPGPDMQWQRYKLPDAAVLLPTGDVLVAGGATQLERYDPSDQLFVPLSGELSGPQEFATATLLDNGEILVLGGYDEQIRTSASAWLVRIPH